MEIRSFTFNPFQTNCFIVHDQGEAVIVDAASSTPAEHAEIEQYVEENQLQVRHLLLTHGHIDHIFGCTHLSERFGMPFKLHAEDVPLLERAEDQAAMFGIPLDRPQEVDGSIKEGDKVQFGGVTWRVLHTPGHSPGSIAFYDEAARVVLSGDVLFAGSIGRTDLWKGSLPILMESIFQKLLPLGDDIRVYSGHGPVTTIKDERRHNPFLNEGMPL